MWNPFKKKKVKPVVKHPRKPMFPKIYFELRKWALEEYKKGNVDKGNILCEISLKVAFRRWEWEGKQDE